MFSSYLDVNNNNFYLHTSHLGTSKYFSEAGMSIFVPNVIDSEAKKSTGLCNQLDAVQLCQGEKR